MIHFLYSLVAFLFAIGILVTVHEWGHFWVARRCGVQVLRFSIGFGRPLLRWHDKYHTEFALAWLPLGGYVKMLNEKEAPVPLEQRHLAFNNQPLFSRMMIVIAGPLANFLFAILLFSVIYMKGIHVLPPIIGQVMPHTAAAAANFRANDEITHIEQQQITSWDEAYQIFASYATTQKSLAVTVRPDRQLTLFLPKTVWDPHTDYLHVLGIMTQVETMPAIVGQVQPESPAANAGFQLGDRIIAINNHPLVGWSDLVSKTRIEAGKNCKVQIERAGRKLFLNVIPIEKVLPSGEKIGVIGLYAQDISRLQRYMPWEAVVKATYQTWNISALSLKMIGQMIVGKADYRNLSGPISIAKGAGQSAQGGLEYYLAFLALISVSLAVINLLPIPMLDGGHFMYYLIEWIRGKPVSEEVQQIGMTIGMAILIGVMSIALYNDFTGL